jgi:hypothetical protein
LGFRAGCPRRCRRLGWAVYCGISYQYGIDECWASCFATLKIGRAFIYVSRGADYTTANVLANNMGGHITPSYRNRGGAAGGRLTTEKNTNMDVCVFFFLSSHFLREMGCSPPLAHHEGFATVAKRREQSHPLFFVRGVVRGKGGEYE